MVAQLAILGAGGIGLGLAAELSRSGHSVRIWSPSLAPVGGDEIRAEGAFEALAPVTVAATVSAALDGAEAVFLCAPAQSHGAIMAAMAPHLRAGMTVIVSAQYSLGALHLARLLRSESPALGKQVRIAAWGTTALTARRRGPLHVQVMTIRPQLDIAAVDSEATGPVRALCAELLGDRFRAASMAAIALGNPNPTAHVPNALCNLTRIETGERWSNYEMMTPAVCALIEQLDAERLQLAERIGVAVRSLADHIHLSFGAPKGTLAEMCRHIFETRGGPAGPADIESRYITEDVPFGLVPISALARVAGLDLPCHAALTDTFSALCRRDFRAENDLLDREALSSMNLEQLRQILGVGPMA